MGIFAERINSVENIISAKEEISLYFGVIDELATLRICKYFMILAQKKKGQYKFYCRIG